MLCEYFIGASSTNFEFHEGRDYPVIITDLWKSLVITSGRNQDHATLVLFKNN